MENLKVMVYSVKIKQKLANSQQNSNEPDTEICTGHQKNRNMNKENHNVQQAHPHTYPQQTNTQQTHTKL